MGKKAHVMNVSSIQSPGPSPSQGGPSPNWVSPVLTVAHGAGGLADGLLQAADDAVLVSEALAVGRPQGLHLAPVLDAVPLQLDPVLVGLLLQLLEVGVLLQKSQQVGHHGHQGGF